MYTEHLKESLGRISAMRDDVTRIKAEALEADASDTSNPGRRYARESGGFEATLDHAVRIATNTAAWVSDHIEPMEREYSRLVSILESIGLDLDESTLSTLELIGKRTWGEKSRETSPYKSERSALQSTIERIISQVQESERETEYETACDALRPAGFVLDEDDDVFLRGEERVVVELTNGRESRYKWSYENGSVSDSGISGEFSRLLGLISPTVAEEVQ